MSRSTWFACSFLLGVAASCKDGGDGLVDHGACDLLIECASDLAPEAREQYIATYGDNGTCWQGGPQQWGGCRDACRMTLDALNLSAMIGGQTCGTCQSDDDCSSYGMGAYCDAGLCLGGSGMQSDGESGDDNADTGPDCLPGFEDCVCAEGGDCLDHLACIDNVCTNPPSPFENCGWSNINEQYGCGHHIENLWYPIACEDDTELMQNASCPQWLHAEGCCDMNGDLWACEYGEADFTDCPPA